MAAFAALVATTLALAGGSTPSSKLGIHNGVITACIETRGNHATLGDLKFNNCAKGFRPLSWNIHGPAGKAGKAGLAGPAGAAGAKGATGAQGPQGIPGTAAARGATGPRGPAGENGSNGAPGAPGAPAPTMLRLTGDFEGTNASVATSLDGVQFGPYSDGGAWGGSVVYHGADGHTLASLTQLSYTVMHSSANDSPIAVPYLRIWLAGGHDVIFDATGCATTVPAEDQFNTFEVVGSNTVRYDDDGCDGVPPDDQPWATVVAAHGTEVIEGIGVTTGFTGGADLTAILRSLKVNGEAFVFGQP